MWCRILKPKVPQHFSVVPECVCHAAYQRERRRTWTRLPIRDHFLHKALILGGFAIVEGGWLDNLPTCQPNEGLRTQEASGEIEIDLVRQSVSKDLVQVRGNVCRGRMMGMVIGTVGRGGSDGERERYNSPFGRKYQGILDHRPGSRILIRVLHGFDALVF